MVSELLEGQTLRDSPDGQQLVALGPDQVSYRVRIDGQGSPVPIRGIESQEHVLRWSADRTAVFVTVPRRKSAQIVRVNVATGQRQPWHAITPPARTGLLGINNVVIAADGQSYAYSMLRELSTLYLVTGLK